VALKGSRWKIVCQGVPEEVRNGVLHLLNQADEGGLDGRSGGTTVDSGSGFAAVVT
jgi:hypothetical protein